MVTYEWRTTLYRPKDEAPKLSTTPIADSNFRSVYGYPPPAAEHITAQGNVRGLYDFAVQSSTLFIDVDEDDHLDEIEKIVAGLGVGYSVWRSGNRGLHFHIDMKSYTSKHLPYSQKKFIESLGLADKVDLTLYRHHSIFRVPGAVHQETGKVKTLIREVAGPVLEIQIVEEPIPEYTTLETGDSVSVARFRRNLLQKRGVGQRHNHLYILFQSGIKAGHDADTVLEWMYWWNSHQSKSHTEDMIYKKWKGFIRGKNQRTKVYKSSEDVCF